MEEPWLAAQLANMTQGLLLALPEAERAEAVARAVAEQAELLRPEGAGDVAAGALPGE